MKKILLTLIISLLFTIPTFAKQNITLNSAIVEDNKITINMNSSDFENVFYYINDNYIKNENNNTVVFDELKSGVEYTIKVVGKHQKTLDVKEFVYTTTSNGKYLGGYNDKQYSKNTYCATSSTIDDSINILATNTKSNKFVVVVDGVGYKIIEGDGNGYAMATFSNLVKGKEYSYYTIAILDDGTMSYSEKDEFVF